MKPYLSYLFFLLSLFAIASHLSANESAKRPNVLVILADDLGYSDLGCYGGEIPTPNIDRLASGGARFTQMYNSARCCPSRASLMTGLYPTQAGIGDFTSRNPSPNRGPGYLGRLREDCATIAEALKPAGYGCYYVGKWHMHPETGPIKRGFDEFYGYTDDHSHDQYDRDYYIRLPESRKPEFEYSLDEYYATDAFNDYALEFIKQGQNSEKPWFVFLGHSSPHFPVQAPAERVDKFEEIYLRGWDALREDRFERMQDLGLANGPEWKLSPKSIVPVDGDDIANGYSGQPNPDWNSLAEDRKRDLARRMAVFAAMVEAIDVGVGRILQHLSSTGDLENTLILFMSDNGACYEWGPFGFDGVSRRGETMLRTGEQLKEAGGHGTHQSYGSGWANLGATPFRMYKHFTHEGGISSPLIAHWPSGFSQRKDWIRSPAHMMDIMPTILDAAGAEYPTRNTYGPIQPLEGISLLDAMQGKPLPSRSIGFDHQSAHAWRSGKWKLVWSKRMPTEIKWELYNLEEDRCELNDLAGTFPEKVDQLAADWEQWARRVGVIWEPAKNETIDNAGVNHEADPKAEDATPQIENSSLTISGRVSNATSDGVIVALGGREHGFAVHISGGKLQFDVRVSGKATSAKTEVKCPQDFNFEARLSPQKMTLQINDQIIASCDSPGLITEQPADGLSIGFDDRTAAGDYVAPNPFAGVVKDITVVTKQSKRMLQKQKETAEEAAKADQFGKEAFREVPTDRKPSPVMDAETIRAGLQSHDRALYIKSGWIRDPYITLGDDDYYYLTGTQPREDDVRERSNPYNIGLGNESIVGDQVRLWRSKDLIQWESMGAIFSIDDTVKGQSGSIRNAAPIWAPEVHWLGDRWALVHCPKQHSSLALTAGKELKGPWTHPMGDSMGQRHDPSLFTDDDGTRYLLWGNTFVAPLSSDLTQYTDQPVRIDPSSYREGPDGTLINRIGHEGATMIKVGGKYVHLGTAWSTDQGRKGSYNLYYCEADKITGPYGPRKFAGRFLGHGTPFQDRDGKWWCTAFFNGNVPPVPVEGIQDRDLSDDAHTINEQGVTIVPLDVKLLDNGSVYIRAKDPAYASPGPDEAQKFTSEL